MNIHCITVDDEPFSLAKIEGFIKRVPYLTLVSSFSSAIEALAFIKQNSVDVIFLDIHMEGLTGIQMLEIIDPKPAVVLTTAYNQYALKGYELNVCDYLLKPYSFERFMKAIEKVCHTLLTNVPASSESDPFIFLKTEYRFEKINFKDITFIESRGDYLYVVTVQTKILTLMTLKSIIEKLPDDKFIRVHKSYIVALDKIDAVEKGRIRIKDAYIPIGDTFRNAVWKRLNILT